MDKYLKNPFFLRSQEFFSIFFRAIKICNGYWIRNFSQSIRQLFVRVFKANYTIPILCLLIILTSCNDNKNTINIAVASNFESTLKTIIKHYKTHKPNVNINIIPGSSGVLANQISNSAPYDLFLSADEKKPKFLFKQLKLSHPPQIYAIGKLALWIPSIDNTERCIDKLKDMDTLVIANPKTAPYGAVAKIILEKHKIQVKKIIYASNISQSFLYTKDAYAQAGFVAYSMLKGYKQGCQQLFEHRALSQSMLLINKKGKDIYDFILSKKIQLLIEKSGYNTLN
jgi:molybdate transport system substrate-binding protein